jgi:hypothetical protein
LKSAVDNLSSLLLPLPPKGFEAAEETFEIAWKQMHVAGIATVCKSAEAYNKKSTTRGQKGSR